MDDRTLLEHYLGCAAPEAARWNLSPESLFLEYLTRSRLSAWVRPTPGYRVVNVGIGVGCWDDWLGYWLEGSGTLTSLDDDPSICRVLAYRQRREQHPNAATVLCKSVLDPALPTAEFDLVTMIGSTAREVGAREAALAACFGLLRTGGGVFYMDAHCASDPADVGRIAERLGHRVRHCESGGANGDAVFVLYAA